MADTRKMKLTIVGQEALASWRKGSGQTTLYEVSAVDEDGVIPDLALRTFGELPTGELMEFDLRRYDDPDRGVSWTIKAPSRGTTSAINELSDQIADLQRRVADLEKRLGDPEALLHPGQRDADHPRGPERF